MVLGLAYFVGSEFTGLCLCHWYSLVSPRTLARTPGLRLSSVFGKTARSQSCRRERGATVSRGAGAESSPRVNDGEI